jgi:hypothetical protein
MMNRFDFLAAIRSHRLSDDEALAPAEAKMVLKHQTNVSLNEKRSPYVLPLATIILIGDTISSVF